MKVIHTIKDLQAELSVLKAQGKKVGLVPTMGALHAGHASLVKRSVNENEVTVVSVFVNPTQFNDKNDLVKYPRTLDADCKLLEACGATYAFAPSVEEMYPEPDTRQFSYAPLDTVMEGAFRPGHFNGVCQIVSKLFEAVKPHRAYFGEKDFQQLAIIREMVRQMQFDLEIVGCPIVREEDGLALSSRNARLSAEERENALKISQTLFKSRTFAATHTVSETLKFVEDAIAAVPGLRLEYFEIVDGNTLQKVDNWNQTSYVVGCITVFCGDVRLIDNIKYKLKLKKDEPLMMIEVLKSKIHCARVTEANLNYMGSITIDENLLDAANMIAGEKVYIADNNNGERFETYIIKGERGSGKICLNGAAARKVQPDDIVIIMSYALMDFEEAKSFKPTVIFPDPATNSVVK